MAVNKNFVVKNGLEVNTKLILADSTNQKVGIASTAPRYELDVRGGIGGTNLYVSEGANITGVTTVAGGGGITTTGGKLYVGDGLAVVGVTTLASAGGISTTGGDLYVG